MVKEGIVEQNNNKVENKKKKSSKKPNKHLTEIKRLTEEREQLEDQLLRKIAEFDNYKKRTERDFFDRVQNANEKLISELLPVLDDMERALDHVEKSQEINSLIEGTNLIKKKLIDILEKQGLKPLPAIGEDFDPEKHDALMQIEKKNVESGTIIEEHLKGYTLNGKVIRHSQVIVAK
jgi:molecular chaperone GrpE